MPNIAKVLREEISRISRHEAKVAVTADGDKTRTKCATKCATDFFGAVGVGLLESCNPLILKGVGMVGVTGLEPVTSCM